MAHKVIRPTITIKARPFYQAVYDALIQNNTTPFVANILARRIDDPDQAIALSQLKLSSLSSPFLMKNMDKASDRVIQAIENGEVIGLETDHDCDGQTAHAILYEALDKMFHHPLDKIRSYIGHRLKEGYGLSEILAHRIVNDSVKPTLVITADNGSTDEPRIALLKSHGIDTIVTDHHTIPSEGTPKSAYAVLNPTQKDCDGDPYIAGCMVAWLLVAAVKTKMQKNQQLPKSDCQLTDLLDFVAVGTVADCVSMAKSVNNRVVAYYGMQKISQAKRFCWQAFREHYQHGVDSEFLGFVIAPLLNSDGRMSDALSSVSFLLSNEFDQTRKWVNFLQQQNQQRKAVQKEITELAMARASQQYQAGQSSICVFLENGHAGVHGISASRIKEAYGLPVILFSPKLDNNELITGSARSIDGLNIKAILDKINRISNTIVKYGGHPGAAGLSIHKKNLSHFSILFNQVTEDFIKRHSITTSPVIYSEGALKENELNLATLDKIAQLEPFGREFEAPIFCNKAEVLSLKMVGKHAEHAQILLKIGNKRLKSIWFFAESFDEISQVSVASIVNVAYKLSKEYFNGKTTLGLKIQYLSVESQ